MGIRIREHAPAAAFAAVGLTALAWVSLYGFAWNDYDAEAAPAVAALVAGHLARFAQLAPAYGGSFVLRAPFAFVPRLWGGGELAVYRLLALPCLLASGALGMWLTARLRARGADRLWRGLALGLCVANPITMRALEIGHPEELLGAVLSVAALLAARGKRAGWAGLLLGLAVANKPWALVAVGPVFVSLTAGRLRALAVAAAVCAAILVPLAAPAGGQITRATGGAATTGTIFQPWQLWWFAGTHGKVVRGLDGQVKPGYRSPPGWLSQLPRPLILAVSIALALAWMRRRPSDVLWLLALILLCRCILDPWNNVYYELPMLVALLAAEVESSGRPVLTLVVTCLTWGTFHTLPDRVSADAQSALFLAWALPLAAVLAARTFAVTIEARIARPAAARAKSLA